ncbi:MAG: M56 family metallopeptidase, partial [Chitinophagaceae bacterium]
MPIVVQYLLKLSLSLGIVYLFYQLLLRKLTFYNCNRFYLLLYTAICFFIPLINITPALETSSWQGGGIVNIIPAWQINNVQAIKLNDVTTTEPLNYWTLLLWLIASGTVIFICIFLVRYFSFLQMRRQARLLSDGGTKVYQVDKKIMPFSFGNAIFINHTLHKEEELREIIRHEFVHVRQKHSVDILWAEFLCMINWYNPFVWLLRKSIRQNLEFIADHQVVKSGMDKKKYQYMLLKVIGNNHFSIASQFNFSSLKTRIAMMNKNQTSKMQLLRLLLLLPAVATLLFAFRGNVSTQDTIPAQPVKLAAPPATVQTSSAAESTAPAIADTKILDAAKDTIPYLNEQGYE